MLFLNQQLTALDVLNIFKEQHRLCSPLDPEADPTVELSFNSTINEWRWANDLLPWKLLYPVLNKEFSLAISKEHWKSVFIPASTKTLKNVCELIASNYSYEHIKPIKLLEKECLSAAVFLTLKKNLKKQGADVSELRPSSLVSPYFQKYFSSMLTQISLMSKGKKIFEQFDLKMKKTDFLDFVNILQNDRYAFRTGSIKTFRDLSFKIIQVSQAE